MYIWESSWPDCMPSNQASAGTSPTYCKYLNDYNLIPSGKAMGNHPCETFPQENWKGDTLHSNRRRSESSMTLDIFYISYKFII